MGTRRLRTLALSILLGACASAAAAALYHLPLDSVTVANRIADLRMHSDTLDHAASFGFPNAPSYTRPDSNIALVTIDEESIGNASAGLGAWPFPRSVYGKLLARLSAAGAKTVAFDVDFLEPAPNPSEDQAFIAGARHVPAVIGYTVTTTSAGIPGAEIPPAPMRAAMQIGFTSIETPGGFVMGQPLQIAPVDQVPGRAAKALALQTARIYLHRPIDIAAIPKFEGQVLTVPFRAIGTVDTTNRIGAQKYSVGFVGQTLSMADALTIAPDQLRIFAKGRLVLVGATAQALNDFAPTIGGLYPGVYVHARLVDQLLTSTYIRPAPAWLDYALIILLPMVLAALLSQIRPTLAIALAAGVVVIYIEIAVALFVYRLYWLDMLHVAGAMIVAALCVVAYRVVGETAQKRAVTNAFGLHVSPGVVDEILKQEGGAASALAGKRAKTTIFYSDIRGFTSMSEKMSPEGVYEQLNEYFEAMCEVIFKYDGYVDKFIGDCIMAIFSAPNQTPDDARKAVEAALDQQEVIRFLGQRWLGQGKQPLSVGMGINTGCVVMGNLGSHKRMNYTVIGDDVNVAARLYNVALGGQIIISESTYEEVKEFFVLRELDPVSVKGKSAPLRTFEVLGRKTHAELIAAAIAAAPKITVSPS